MKVYLLAALAALFLAHPLQAQTSGSPNEGAVLSPSAPVGGLDGYDFSWWGLSGRNYFLQQSEDLVNWSYLSIIEPGADQVIDWGFASNAGQFFLRLRYSEIPAVSAGAFHSLALNSDGTVFAWGDNSHGELGDGTTTPRTSAVQTTGLTNMIAVSGGAYHSLALKVDGSVWAWGANGTGQLGNGTIADKSLPQQVASLSGFVAVAVSAGDGFSAALGKGGVVYTWGANWYGQLGDGTTTDRLLPVQASMGSVTSICAGDSFMLAMGGDGSVWAWGANWSGQLGNGSTTNSSGPVQVQLTDPSGARAIAAGTGFGLALCADGILYAWGANDSGQLGNNSTTASSVPVQVQLSDTSGVTAIAAGDGYALAICADGNVYAWGANFYGQLGNNSTVNSLVPVLVGNLTGAVPTAIAAGSGHVLALLPAGGIQGWGYNGQGQLGDGSTTDQQAAVDVAGWVPSMPPLPLSNQVACGPIFTLLLKADGTVWGFGANNDGQLGLDIGIIQASLPGPVPGLPPISSVAAGSNHSVALANDGTVWTWGADNAYQLGYEIAGSLAPAQVPGLSGVIAIAAGGDHTMALKSDGTVWTWGDNSYGELGYTGSPGGPAQVVALAGIRIIAIAAGNYHSLALASDGTIWAFGNNAYGELGNNTFTGGTTPEHVLGAGGGLLTNVVSIACGGYHSLAVISGGAVCAFGNNSSGQLGLNSTTNAAEATSISGLSNVTAIAGGQSHSLAITSAGSIYAWGSNSFGELGVASSSPSLLPMQVSGLAGAIQASAGENDSVVILNDGSVSGFGYNDSGELGNGAIYTTAVPVICQVTGINAYGYAPVTVSTPGGTVVADGSASIALGAHITANAGDVVQVCYYNGGILLGTSTESPFTWAWDDVPPGLYSVSAKTMTTEGKTSTSPTVLIKVMRPGFDSVTAGMYYGSFLRSDGTVWSVGRNLVGGLGDGTTVQRLGPVWVRGLNEIVAVENGYTHSLALRSDGTVWAWGNNSNGQLGNNTTVSSYAPIQVPGLSGIVAISAGQQFSLAIDSNQNVWAWGLNGNGQLGNNSTVDSHVPIMVQSFSGAVAIAAGNGSSYAIDGNGKLWSWGANRFGQLGNNSTTDAHLPVAVFTGAVSVSTGGGQFALAIDTAGNVWAWGESGLQLGGSTTPMVPMQVSGVSGVVSVAAGNAISLALDNTGVVWAFGSAAVLGNNSYPSGSATPVQVLGVDQAVGIAIAQNHAYALRADGTVWGWGQNSYGELGTGNTSSSTLLAAQVGGLCGTIATAEGASHTVTLRSDGTVWTFGSNSSGQLGNNSLVSSVSPVQATGIPDAVAVAAGASFSLVLDADGSVWSFGDNTYGELGDGSLVNEQVPIRIPSLSGVVAISAGANFALALESNGTVMAWGSGAYGQIGNNSTANSPIPVPVSNLSSINQIAAGGFHALAMQASGAVWSWGYNNDGQLGYSAGTNGLVPTQVSFSIAPYIVTEIAAGRYHSMALDSGSSVFDWGDGANGQLAKSPAGNSTAPYQVGGLPAIISIAAGEYHSIATSNTGTIWMWGDDSVGELGNNSTVNSTTPVQLAGFPSGAVAISSSNEAEFTFAIKNDGTLWGWGLNTSGQLEDGTTTNRLVPVSALNIGPPAIGTGAPTFTLTVPANAVLLP